MHMVRIAIPQVFGGARRDRTADPLLAKQVLSQLSYGPVIVGGSGKIRTSDLTLIRGAL
jgi:hypothetical protein